MPKKKHKIPKTRDYLMVEIIKGVTKSGPHQNKKKKNNKIKCRKPVLPDEQ